MRKVGHGEEEESEGMGSERKGSRIGGLQQ